MPHNTIVSEIQQSQQSNAMCLRVDAACRRVTWLTQHADLQSGLLHMQADRARWRALHAALGAT